jgi:IclR family acetate operon transcriptional repressor
MSRQSATQPGTAADPYFSRAVAKAFEALEIIRESKNAVPLHTIAGSIGLSKASAIRILSTLESLGYIAKRDDGYVSSDRPAPGRAVDALVRCAAEPLRRLVQATRETASLGALFENHIEVVLVVESPQLIRMGNTMGRILPPHASSMGKAVAAFQPAEVRERLLRSYGTARITDTSICDPGALDEEFANIRRRGHAEDWGESTPEAVCFGAPILDRSGKAIAAVSVSLPRVRLGGEGHKQALIDAVQKTASEIARGLAGTTARDRGGSGRHKNTAG